MASYRKSHKRHNERGLSPGHTTRRAKVLHRAVVFLSLAGLSVSAYLTYLQYSGAQAAFCAQGSGCDIVRSSGYSQVWGIPVALLGLLGYAATLSVSLWPGKSPWQWPSLFLLSLAGFTFSAYLTYLELAVIGAICAYCVVSFLLITGILVAVIMERPPVPRLSAGWLGVAGGLVVALVVTGSALALSPGTEAPAQGDFTVKLAKHLSKEGIIMYGAWWCPHCTEQKKLFGPAFSSVNYVECDPKGKEPNPLLCRQKGIRGYPTWEIKGRLYEGLMPLERLAALSGFSYAKP